MTKTATNQQPEVSITNLDLDGLQTTGLVTVTERTTVNSSLLTQTVPTYSNSVNLGCEFAITNGTTLSGNTFARCAIVVTPTASIWDNGLNLIRFPFLGHYALSFVSIGDVGVVTTNSIRYRWRETVSNTVLSGEYQHNIGSIGLNIQEREQIFQFTYHCQNLNDRLALEVRVPQNVTNWRIAQGRCVLLAARN